MPYSPIKGIDCPNTLFVAVNCEFPSALKTASLFANTLNTLSSQKTTKSEFLVKSFCILPYVGFMSFVIFSACINWFKLLVSLLSL